MSNLLISEHPLMVLPELAKAIGLNEAIILQQVHYWLGRSENIKDGHRWVYNSYPQWQEQFPFWGINTIKRSIYSLEESGLLVSGNYNKAKMDKTKWYRIDYNRLSEVEAEHFPSAQNGSIVVPKRVDERPNVDRPIPETTTKTNSSEAIQPKAYRKRLGVRTSEEKVLVNHPFQAKAEYVMAKLQTPPHLKTSVLKACKERPELIDDAVTFAADAPVASKTMLFFKRIRGLGR